MVMAANDTTVASRFFGFRRQNTTAETAIAVKSNESLECGRFDQRNITRQDQHIAVVTGEMLTRSQDGMTCSKLLFLVNKSDFRNRGLDLIRGMAQNDADVGG